MVIKKFMEAEDLYRRGDLKGSLKICDKIIKKHKDSPIIADALFLSGEIYLARHQYNDASDAFNEIVLKHNNSPLFEAAVVNQFDIGRALHRGDRPHYFGVIPGFKDRNSAVKYYEKVINNAPFSNYAQDALFNIYKLQRRAKKYDLAFVALDRLIDEYPTSTLLPRAYLELADMYESLGKGPDYDQEAVSLALNYYKDFIVLFPTHESVGFVKERIDKLSAELIETNLNIGDFYYNAKHNPKAAYIMYKAASEIDGGDDIKSEVQAKMDGLIAGVPPAKTPVDFLFKKYKGQDIAEWVNNGCVDVSNNNVIQKDMTQIGIEGSAEQSGSADASNGFEQTQHDITQPIAADDETPYTDEVAEDDFEDNVMPNEDDQID
jgi:outer membrane protein assembly factor BamD